MKLSPSVRIWVCTQPQDLRRSFDGLALVARTLLGEDPQSGAVFAFANKRMNRLKLLWWDRNGYCLLYKRLHGAAVRLPSARDASLPRAAVHGDELAALLSGVTREKRRSRRSAA
jgi:transposase